MTKASTFTFVSIALTVVFAALIIAAVSFFNPNGLPHVPTKTTPIRISEEIKANVLNNLTVTSGQETNKNGFLVKNLSQFPVNGVDASCSMDGNKVFVQWSGIPHTDTPSTAIAPGQTAMIYSGVTVWYSQEKYNKRFYEFGDFDYLDQYGMTWLFSHHKVGACSVLHANYDR